MPYIGDLVGSKGLSDFPGTPYSLRAAVADTIGNRHRAKAPPTASNNSRTM